MTLWTLTVATAPVSVEVYTYGCVDTNVCCMAFRNAKNMDPANDQMATFPYGLERFPKWNWHWKFRLNDFGEFSAFL